MNPNFIGWGYAIPILIPFGVVLIGLMYMLIKLLVDPDAVNIFNDEWGARGPDGLIVPA